MACHQRVERALAGRERTNTRGAFPTFRYKVRPSLLDCLFRRILLVEYTKAPQDHWGHYDREDMHSFHKPGFAGRLDLLCS